ncbi:MAG: hypothetical protein OXH93_19445 [Caldilineaceae bacterium]|nr:hypothetical protein [Caldilineaceae bacterium]
MNGLSLRTEAARQRCFDLRMHTNHVFRALKEGVREVAETASDKRKAETACRRLDQQFDAVITAIDRAEIAHRDFVRATYRIGGRGNE